MASHSNTAVESSGTQTSIDFDQLQIAIASAKERFGRIRTKYPQIRGYLVISLLGKQGGLTSSGVDIMKSLPSMVIDDAAKSAMQTVLKNPPDKDAGEKDKRLWNDRLHELATALRFRGDYLVEIRFDQLDYELISRLQADELVDRELTPQTRASIRIVLGTLGGLLPE